VLTKPIDALHAVAAALVVHETLSGEKLRGILAGQPMARTHRLDDQRRAGHGMVSSAGRSETEHGGPAGRVAPPVPVAAAPFTWSGPGPGRSCAPASGPIVGIRPRQALAVNDT
jgi:hypothetical protein